jgi:HEAT repeat protein
VRRAAVLALGSVTDPRAFDRLKALLQGGTAPVRAAAARGLARQARGPEAAAVQRRVVPLLQKTLEDPALEVVVAAAEELGALGVPEAGPVLTGLLRHPSEEARQTAALALERVADATVLDSLLDAPDDPAAKVRFSLVGALGHAAGAAALLSEDQRHRLLKRLETLLLKDADPGVRSRAATVLGECGPPSILPALWRSVLAAEDSRVQEKAWAAMIDVLSRAASPDLLRQWDATLAEAHQDPRRLQLLTELYSRWQKRDDARALVGGALNLLIPAQLEQGKWALAFPLIRELLAQPAPDADQDRRLRWLLVIGQQALHDGNRAEAQRATQAAEPHLAGRDALTAEFQKLQRRAKADP